MENTRIMYIENKKDGELAGPARIGRVTFSQSGKTIYYKGKCFHRVKGFKSNYLDVDTGEHYWISGCRKDGRDALYNTSVEIDEDVQEEYWLEIRNLPENVKIKKLWVQGKY